MSGYYDGTNKSRSKRSQSRTLGQDGDGTQREGDNGVWTGQINYSRSYAVQFQEAKTSSQVQLSDLNHVRGYEAKSSVSECSA